MSKYNPITSIYGSHYGLTNPEYLGVTSAQTDVNYGPAAEEMGADRGRVGGQIAGAALGIGAGLLAGKSISNYLKSYNPKWILTPQAVGLAVLGLLTGVGTATGSYLGARAGRKRYGNEYENANYLANKILEKGASAGMQKEALWNNLLYTIGRRIGSPLIRGSKWVSGKALSQVGHLTGEKGLIGAGSSMVADVNRSGKNIKTLDRLERSALNEVAKDPANRHLGDTMQKKIREVGNVNSKSNLATKKLELDPKQLDKMKALQKEYNNMINAGILGTGALTYGAYKGYDMMKGTPRYVMPLKYSEHVPFTRVAKPDWMVAAENLTEFLQPTG